MGPVFILQKEVAVMPTRIVTDGSMDKLIEAPSVVLPEVSEVFSARAKRFDALSSSASMGGYMRLMACLCQGQAHATLARPGKPIDDRAIANSRDYGMPPLSARVTSRDSLWLEDLTDILVAAKGMSEVLTPPLESALNTLALSVRQDPSLVEAIADRLIAGEPLPEDGPSVPFVGAALQVYFGRLASALDVADVSASDVATVCPCCGMRPIASVIRLDPDRVNYRYLVCALCMTEWNMARVRCSACESEKSVGYLIIDDDRAANDAAIRAETCDECKSYLKIFLLEKNPLMDVIADDLDSLALDILVDEKGYGRTGPNLLFYPGQS